MIVKFINFLKDGDHFLYINTEQISHMWENDEDRHTTIIMNNGLSFEIANRVETVMKNINKKMLGL